MSESHWARKSNGTLKRPSTVRVTPFWNMVSHFLSSVKSSGAAAGSSICQKRFISVSTDAANEVKAELNSTKFVSKTGPNKIQQNIEPKVTRYLTVADFNPLPIYECRKYIDIQEQINRKG